MPDAPSRQLLESASVFLVADVVRAAEYYRDKLGFRFDHYWGDPPDFCMVWRDCHCVMLSQPEDPAQVRPVSTVKPSVFDAYFWVADVDALFEEFRSRGALIDYEPSLQVYGVREFGVRDPDGHLIAFGKEVEEENDHGQG